MDKPNVRFEPFGGPQIAAVAALVMGNLTKNLSEDNPTHLVDKAKEEALKDYHPDGDE